MPVGHCILWHSLNDIVTQQAANKEAFHPKFEIPKYNTEQRQLHKCIFNQVGLSILLDDLYDIVWNIIVFMYVT